MYCNIRNVNILTSLLVKHGIRHVVVCPGSRNAPIVHNLNEHPDIVCHAVTDERTASFVALGIRERLGEAVAVCVTSGSALLNVLPGVAEATYRNQGIVVISADRPQAWIDQLDGQTLPQHDALGRFVGMSVSLPEPHTNDECWHCNRLVNEVLIMACKRCAPSVHINVPISEPLFDFSVEHLPNERVIRLLDPNDQNDRESLREIICRNRRIMVVLGQMHHDEVSHDTIISLTRSAVVLFEPLGVNNQNPLHVEEMMCVVANDEHSYAPECVVYAGGHTVSKRLRQYLRNLPETTEHILITEDGRLRDISQHTTTMVCGQSCMILQELAVAMADISPDSDYLQSWQKTREYVCKIAEAYEPRFSQMAAVKNFEDNVRENDQVFYANSMAVRLGAVYAKHHCHCNRGLNGIEGSLSVAVGAALAYQNFDTTDTGLVFCVIGDLSFFYDQNALWLNKLPQNLRVLLLNNHGGAIFRNLPGLSESPVAKTFVSGSHNATASYICKQHDIAYLCAFDRDTLDEGIILLTDHNQQGPILLEVLTDADVDAEVYKDYIRLFT